jgi:hypothetical protein
MRVANDTVRINVSTAPVYGALEPQRRAMLMAAQETLKNGFDKFMIVEGQSGFNRNVIGYSPGYAHGMSTASINGSSGQATSQFSAVGPAPVAMPRFEAGITVKMFKADDPGAKNAVDARSVLAEANSS